MKKILTGFGIIVMLFAGLYLYYGPLKAIAAIQYSESQVKKDIKNGEVWLVQQGLPTDEYQDDGTISRRYGFMIDYVGCVISDEQFDEFQAYNKLANEWLDQRNGKDWEKRYAEDVRKAAVSLQMVPVFAKDGYGFIDQQANWVIEPAFDGVNNFSEGLGMVRAKDFKYGFINETGQYVVQPQFKDARSFSEGFASVMRDDLSLAFINEKGQTVIELPASIDEIGSFKEGLAVIRSDGKYGFIDTKGKIVIPCEYAEAENFSDGLAKVAVMDNGSTAYGFISREGRFIIKPRFKDAGSFRGGVAAVKSNGKYGFIDKTGRMVIQPKFERAKDFHNNLCAVKKDGLWGYITLSGEMAIKPQFKLARNFTRNHLAAIYSDNSKWGFINQSGEVIIEPQFELVNDFMGNVSFGLTDADGMTVRMNEKGELFPSSTFKFSLEFYQKYLNLDKLRWKKEGGI